MQRSTIHTRSRSAICSAPRAWQRRSVSLSVRFTFALSIAALLLFGAAGTWQLRAEDRELRRAVEHDVELLGRSLQVSFENALRDRQDEDVQETLTALERIDPTVDVFVYDARGALLAASAEGREQARWRAARPRHSELRFVESPYPGSVELLIPLAIPRDEAPATLVVTRPLEDMRQDLAATRVRVIGAVTGFVLLVALLSMALARFGVGRPLAAMIARMKRVRAGDFSPSALPARNDEVGETLREFEALVRALQETRSRLDAEAEARQRVEAQLREVDKLRAVGQLAAGVAHEIGSPLQILEGRLAGLDAKADDPAETRRVSRILLEQAQRITRIVSRLTNLARRPAGASRMFDALAPVRTVVELLEGEGRRRGVTIALAHDSQLPVLEGDPDAIQQLVLNLVRNAIDASKPGGKINVSLAAAEWKTPTGALASGLRFTVEDDGAGMDDDTSARAFEPFFTTRRASGGTGLGLAVVAGIAQELDATIALESTPGHGTRFTIDIPAGTDRRGAHAA